MDAVRTHLVRRAARVVLVLTPPFDQSAQDPGYIKGYPPGMRENGGQYTHAAVWTVMAGARLRNGDEAVGVLPRHHPPNNTPRDPKAPLPNVRAEATPRGGPPHPPP